MPAAGLRRLVTPAIAVALLFPSNLPAMGDAGGRDVAVETVAIEFDVLQPTRILFGALRFAGGVELLSDDPQFGGFSGLTVSGGGKKLIAASDQGQWLTADIVYRAGRVETVTNAQMAPMLSATGRPFASKDERDVEGLGPVTSGTGTGSLLVALERRERILIYDLETFGFLAEPASIPLPEAASAAPFNKELEAVGMFPDTSPLSGTVIAVSEAFLDDKGNVRGWLIGGGSPGGFTVRRSNDFDITDLDILPNGDLVILERSFSPATLAGMRLRRVPAAEIARNSVLEGEVLLSVNQPHYTIDNMEGVAAHYDADGTLRLTVISDNNFNAMQRTLLLQFTLEE